VAVLLAVAGLLGAVFASLSNGVAVLTRQRETLIGIVTMVTLLLTFLSSALMQQSLLPGWIRWIAKFNPVNWAADAGRSRQERTPTGGSLPAVRASSPCSCSRVLHSRPERSGATRSRSNRPRAGR